MIPNNQFFKSVPPSGGGVSVLQPWYDSLAVKPSAGLWTDLKIMADTLVTANKWNEIDFLSIIAAMETDEQRLKPLYTTSGLDITAINSPTLSVDGVQGNGSTSYLNLNWIPSSNGLKYTLDDSSISTYNTTAGAPTRYLLSSENSAGTNAAYIRRYTDFKGSINGSNSDVSSALNGLGFKGIARVNSTNIFFKLNSTNSSNIASNSVSLPTLTFFGCARNNNGTAVSLSSDTIRHFAFGSNALLTDDIFYNALNTFFASRGLATY